jgi:predicted nuclease of predicted toxin-antitoxin system
VTQQSLVKLKLDEQLGSRVADRLGHAGHDVHTVADERLVGANDDTVLAARSPENRALVTNDLDFSNPRRYPPANDAGIVVARV